LITSKLIDDFVFEHKEKAKNASKKTVKALWNILGEMHEYQKSA
jgi:hypothetical protein